MDNETFVNPSSARLALPTVTLLAVTSTEIEETHRAMVHSMARIDFAAAKLICFERPANLHPGIQHFSIPRLDYVGYNHFVLTSIHRHVATEFCLVMQADGFVLNPHKWNNAFLNFDYIGAPWPDEIDVTSGGKLKFDKNRVGNGGFSLRSRRLLEITSGIPYDDLPFPIKSEDLIICHYLYAKLVALGIRFAPPEIAAQFSIESPGNLFGQTIYSVFGFHSRSLRDALFPKTVNGT